MFTGSCGCRGGVLGVCGMSFRYRFRLGLENGQRVFSEPGFEPLGSMVPCRSLALTSADAALVFTVLTAAGGF